MTTFRKRASCFRVRSISSSTALASSRRFIGAFRLVMRVSRDASRAFFALAQTRLQAGGSCGSLRENPSGVDPHVIIAMLHVEQSFREPLRHWSDWSNGTSCSGRARPAWMGAEERKAVSARMTRYWPAWRARSEIPKMATPLYLGGGSV